MAEPTSLTNSLNNRRRKVLTFSDAENNKHGDSKRELSLHA